jgi:2-oxoglutarate ferredoxin oxidoreductase subunit beta
VDIGSPPLKPEDYASSLGVAEQVSDLLSRRRYLDFAAEADVLVHDAHREDPTFAFMLANLDGTPGFPTPVGVFRSVRRSTGDELTWQLIEEAKAAVKKPLSVTEFLSQGDTWTVK